MDMSELPNDRLIETMIESYSATYPKLGIGLDIIDKRIGKGAINEGMRRVFSPTILGIDTSLPGYKAFIENENKKTAEANRRSRPIKNIIDRLFSEREKSEKQGKM